MTAIVRVYADLVRKGEKSIEEVPKKIREAVSAFLAGNEA